jgi:hypothetical protein
MSTGIENWCSVCLGEFANNDAFWKHMAYVQCHFDSKSGKMSWNNDRKIEIDNKREQVYEEIVPVKKPRESGISGYMWYSDGNADTSDQETYNPLYIVLL